MGRAKKKAAGVYNKPRKKTINREHRKVKTNQEERGGSPPAKIR